MAGYAAALNKIEILLVRKKGGIAIGKLATLATAMYWISTRETYLLCKSTASW